MENFNSSIKEMKQLRSVLITAMLIALNLTLDKFSIQVTSELRIGISFLTIALTGMLYGPVVAMLSAAACDILSAILTPRGAYFPGFTVSAIAGGLIYGLLLYRKEVTVLRMALTKGLINLLVNIGLNTLWLTFLYGNSFWVILPARATKNALMLLVEVPLLYLVTKAMQVAFSRNRKAA